MCWQSWGLTLTISWLYFVLASLAAYRLAELVAIDVIAQPLRSVFGRFAAGKRQGGLAWYLAYLVNCPYCLGIWFAAVLALLLQPNSILQYLLYWFGVAGAQTMLQSLVGRNKE